MKKHISLSYAVLIIAAASLGSCAVDVEEVSKGGIAGIVADKVTGEPVPTVKLKLSPGGNSTVTGSDGSFQFEELEAGEYTVTYTKDGYRDGTEKLLVKNTLKTDAHLLIERIPAIITTDKEILDFGENSGVTSLSFNLINSSYKPLEWNVDYTCTWIKEIKPKTSGILNYGKTATLIVEIDREELEAGNNETYIVVYSEDGSAEVKVTAIGGERHIPSLIVSDATSITSNSAILNGKIQNAGSPEYFERGFVYAQASMPTLDNGQSVTVARTDDLDFSYALDGIELGKKYFVRSYAKNIIKRAETVTYSSNEISFVTKSTSPIMTISDVTELNVTQGTVMLIGKIENAGDPAYTEKGFVYAAHNNPLYENDFKVPVPGNEIGLFRQKIEGPKIDTQYYVRAYSLSKIGIFYSDETTFILASSAPMVSIKAVSDISVIGRSVTFNGCVDAAGEPAYTEKGFVYGDSNTPTINDIKVLVEGSEVGNYSVSVKNLEVDKIYYLRAYAIGRNGISYSNDVQSFVIKTTAPVVSMVSVEDLNASTMTARLKASITNEGNPPYIRRGFVYGTNFNPTLSDNKKEDSGMGTGSFECELMVPSMDTKYYVRAFVTNSLQTIYSHECLYFSLENTSPSVSQLKIEQVSYSDRTVMAFATVTNAGIPQYEEKGFVYSLSRNPILGKSNSLTVSGSGIGGFSTVIKGVQPQSVYYIRAYIKNHVGVFYGEESSFSIIPTLASVSLDSISDENVYSQSIQLHGSVLDFGDPKLVERGFVYGFLTSPSVENGTKVSVKGEGDSYHVTIGELELNRKYYVRAYVINEAGISYSEKEMNFTLSASLADSRMSGNPIVDYERRTISVSGYLWNLGTPTAFERGFVYSTKLYSPTLENNEGRIVVPGVDLNSFTLTIPSVEYDAEYHVRSYAINALGVAYSTPVVISTACSVPSNLLIQTLDIDYSSNSVMAKIYVGNLGTPQCSEVGVVYSSDTVEPSLDNCEKAVCGTIVSGYQKISIKNLDKTKRYYMRAYAKNYKGVVYSDVGEAVMYETYEIETTGLMVQTHGGYGDFNTANTACENSNASGYTNWRLPSISELSQVYECRSLINMPYSSSFWSMSKYDKSSRSAYYILSRGLVKADYVVNSNSYRCVRNVDGTDDTSVGSEDKNEVDIVVHTLSATTGSRPISSGPGTTLRIQYYAELFGSVVVNKGSYMERGFVVNSSGTPTFENSTIQIVLPVTTSESGEFSGDRTFGVNTNYYYRAYVKTSNGEYIYGDTFSFIIK